MVTIIVRPKLLANPPAANCVYRMTDVDARIPVTKNRGTDRRRIKNRFQVDGNNEISHPKVFHVNKVCAYFDNGMTLCLQNGLMTTVYFCRRVGFVFKKWK